MRHAALCLVVIAGHEGRKSAGHVSIRHSLGCAVGGRVRPARDCQLGLDRGFDACFVRTLGLKKFHSAKVAIYNLTDTPQCCAMGAGHGNDFCICPMIPALDQCNHGDGTVRQGNDGEGRMRPTEDAADTDRTDDQTQSAFNPGSVEWLARAAIARLAAEAAARAGAAAEPVPESVVDDFCKLLVAGDYIAAEAEIRRLTARRQNYAQISDGLLSMAARRLGRGWEEDSLSFADVSVAVAQIFRLNQAFRQRNVPLVRGADRFGVFATLPGQPHNLGLVLAAEAFRGEGWKVDLRLDTPARELIEITQRLRPTLIGLTISREDRRHQLAHLVISLRALPMPLRIMLGGRGAHGLARILPRGHIDRVVTDIASALREA